jgi:hypothetical protein
MNLQIKQIGKEYGIIGRSSYIYMKGTEPEMIGALKEFSIDVVSDEAMRQERKDSGKVILVSIRHEYLEDKFNGEEIEYRSLPASKPVEWMVIHESGRGVCAVAKVDAVLKSGEIPGETCGGYHMTKLYRIPLRPYQDYSVSAPQNFHYLALTDQEIEKMIENPLKVVEFQTVEQWRRNC